MKENTQRAIILLYQLLANDMEPISSNAPIYVTVVEFAYFISDVSKYFHHFFFVYFRSVVPVRVDDVCECA